MGVQRATVLSRALVHKQSSPPPLKLCLPQSRRESCSDGSCLLLLRKNVGQVSLSDDMCAGGE